MTDQKIEQRDYSAVPDTGGPASPGPAPKAPDAWSGWVRFAAVVMVIVGVFGVIEGLAAVLTPAYYVTTAGGAVFLVSLATWGWVHLIVGVLVALLGGSLMREAPSWVRGCAVALVALSAILHLTFIAAAPLWSIVVIVLEIFVLYALIVTWDSPLRVRR